MLLLSFVGLPWTRYVVCSSLFDREDQTLSYIVDVCPSELVGSLLVPLARFVSRRVHISRCMTFCREPR